MKGLIVCAAFAGLLFTGAAAMAAPANLKLVAFEYKGKKSTDLNAGLQAHPGDAVTFYLSGDAGDHFQSQKNVVSADGRSTKPVDKVEDHTVGADGQAKFVWNISAEGKPGGRIIVFGSPRLKADGTAEKLVSWIFEVVK